MSDSDCVPFPAHQPGPHASGHPEGAGEAQHGGGQPQRLQPLSDAPQRERWVWATDVFKIRHEPTSWFELYDDIKFSFCVDMYEKEKLPPPAAIRFFHVNFFGVKWQFHGCLWLARLSLLSPLRAADPRQGQRVLRHVHHRQLRLCAASALEEPQETLWLLFQPGSAAEEPLRQVRRVLNVAPRLTQPRTSAEEWHREETDRKTIQPWWINVGIFSSTPKYGSTSISVSTGLRCARHALEYRASRTEQRGSRVECHKDTRNVVPQEELRLFWLSYPDQHGWITQAEDKPEWLNAWEVGISTCRWVSSSQQIWVRWEICPSSLTHCTDFKCSARL